MRSAAASFYMRHLLAAAIVVAFAAVTQARVWHVNADGSGDTPTIQAALDSADAGDEIVLAPGVYSWTTQGESRSVGSMLQFTEPVTLRGAAGAAQTILDGERQGRIAFCGGGPTLRGLTIRNGRAPAGYPGGGLRAFGGLIAECVFEDNECTTGPNANGNGGALSLIDGQIEDCLIVGNQVGMRQRGGGVLLLRSTMRRCIVRDNSTGGEGGSGGGGGAYSTESLLEDTRFERNTVLGLTAVQGGALHSNRDRIVRCTFVENVIQAGSSAGAGIYGDPVAVEQCVFIGNRLPGAAAGAALHGVTAVPVDRCTFIDNSSGVFNAVVTRSILAGCSQGPPCEGSGSIACSALFQNPTTRGECATAGANLSEDPQFCAVDPGGTGNVALQADSPCLQMACGPIGAVAVAGCDAVAVEATPWTAVKMRYRPATAP